MRSLVYVCLPAACRMCKIVCGEIVCDPMCGGGSIPIEVSFMLFIFTMQRYDNNLIDYVADKFKMQKLTVGDFNFSNIQWYPQHG